MVLQLKLIRLFLTEQVSVSLRLFFCASVFTKFWFQSPFSPPLFGKSYFREKSWCFVRTGVLNLLESSNTNRDLEWLCVIITSFSIKRELLRVISNLIYKTLPAKCLWPHIQTSFLWNKVFEVTDFMNLASRRPVGVRWCERVTFWSRG